MQLVAGDLFFKRVNKKVRFNSFEQTNKINLTRAPDMGPPSSLLLGSAVISFVYINRSTHDKSDEFMILESSTIRVIEFSCDSRRAKSFLKKGDEALLEHFFLAIIYYRSNLIHDSFKIMKKQILKCFLFLRKVPILSIS